MKLLKLHVTGLPLFKEPVDLTFYATQRVSDEDSDRLYPLFSNIYLNCAQAMIGLNASGKTSMLKVILLALSILNNEPINYAETKDILGNSEKVTFDIYFCTKDRKICRLQTIIAAGEKTEEGYRYRIIEETLWEKEFSEVRTRKTLTDFEKIHPARTRGLAEDYLPDDVSIIIARNKQIQEKLLIQSMLSFTNRNVLPATTAVPLEIVTFLDPSVEKLCFVEKEQERQIYLKFFGSDGILLNHADELNQFLSSGTIKGMIAFSMAQDVLKKGGYLIMDEIENHFNKEIVATLLRFFMDAKLNSHGGILIFTTHYPEILDEYERNDAIYILRNQDGITAENLSALLKRNDIKRSDAYQSGILEGTVPSYEAYLRLKKELQRSIRMQEVQA